MIIVLGKNQAFPEAFAQWLSIRGHVVCIEADEPESYIADSEPGVVCSLEDMFGDFSEGEK